MRGKRLLTGISLFALTLAVGIVSGNLAFTTKESKAITPAIISVKPESGGSGGVGACLPFPAETLYELDRQMEELERSIKQNGNRSKAQAIELNTKLMKLGRKIERLMKNSSGPLGEPDPNHSGLLHDLLYRQKCY